ncbi:MAG: hypothetical protein IPJ76_13375 [Flavobacteriales bacterium]|nr:MAG: hypothetical protein IPJ76_13375 [Flavobacteriales bacterium]
MPDEVDYKAYWREQGHKLVDTAYDRLTTGLESVGTYLTGLITGYTITALVESYFVQLTHGWQYWVLLIPVLIAVIGKWYTTIAVLPGELVEFSPESWEQCKAVRTGQIVVLAKRLRVAKLMAHCGAMAMVAALVLQMFLERDKQALDRDKTTRCEQAEKLLSTADTSFVDVQYAQRDHTVHLRGSFAPKDTVRVWLAYGHTLILDTTEMTDRKGLLDLSVDGITVPGDSLQYGIEYRQTKEVTRQVLGTLPSE